jgi:hypothetical protein
MTKKAALLLAILTLATLSLWAQSGTTTYNLPNSSCSVQGTSYLYCSSMGVVNISGTIYSTFLSGVDVVNLYQNPASAIVNPGGSFNLQNVYNAEDRLTMHIASGTYENRRLTVNFAGAFNGTVDLDPLQVVPKPPCYRTCQARWIGENVVLTLE